MSAKVEVNGGGPLPQRPQKNVGEKNVNKPPMEGPAEKKPRFNQSGPAQNRNNNQNQNKGFGNNNKGFGNRNNQGGNQKQNQNMNKGNFQNQNQNQQQKQAPQAQPAKDEKKEVIDAKPIAGVNNPQQQQQNKQQNQQQNKQQNPQQNQQQSQQQNKQQTPLQNKQQTPLQNKQQNPPQNQQQNKQQNPPQNQQQNKQQNPPQNPPQIPPQNQTQNQAQNQPQNQQQQSQSQQNINQNQINQNYQPNQLNPNLNRQQHQGGGGFGGGGFGGGGFGGDGMNRGNRDRGQKRDRNFGDRNFGDRNFGNRDGRDGGGQRGGGGDAPRGNRNDEFFVNQRLRAISGPTHEIEPVETGEESKFSGRNRLYIGNLTGEVSEEELRELFKPYGEIGEVFCNSEKNFAFLKLDYHTNAERAKRELDGSNRKGRLLRVRFAPNATILRISNLTPFVSNELLYRSFEIFGPVEKAVVSVDDRGKSTGEGVVEFAKKSSANICLRYCNEKCFFLTASLRPCVVEPCEPSEDTDGLPDKSLNKKMPEFNHERSVGPRFADRGSFEHEYGTRWKQLYELFKSKKEALNRELKLEEEKLEAQMEYGRYEHETELLRQELRKRELDNERKKMEWEMREKQAEEMRKRDEEQVSRQQTEMQSRMMRQEEEMRRRQQENTLFMQAQQLNSLLDQQEGGFSGNCNNFEGFGGNNASPFEFRGKNNNNNSGGGNGPNGSNGPNNQQDFGIEFGGNQNQQSGNDGNRGSQRGGNNAANNNPWERRRRF